VVKAAARVLDVISSMTGKKPLLTPELVSGAGPRFALRWREPINGTGSRDCCRQMSDVAPAPFDNRCLRTQCQTSGHGRKNKKPRDELYGVFCFALEPVYCTVPVASTRVYVP
jgi:hypothetical protein